MKRQAGARHCADVQGIFSGQMFARKRKTQGRATEREANMPMAGQQETALPSQWSDETLALIERMERFEQ